MSITIDGRNVIVSNETKKVTLSFEQIYHIKKKKIKSSEYEYIGISKSFTREVEEQFHNEVSQFFPNQPRAPYRCYLLDWMRIVSLIEKNPDIMNDVRTLPNNE